MMTNEESNKIVHFIIPGAGFLVLGRGHVSRIPKRQQEFFKSLLLYSKVKFRQTEYKVK